MYSRYESENPTKSSSEAVAILQSELKHLDIASGPEARIAQRNETHASRPRGRSRRFTAQCESAERFSRSRLEHVTQRRDKRVDSAADVLQINEQNLKGIHHVERRPSA
jgi:hypothetical protein